MATGLLRTVLIIILAYLILRLIGSVAARSARRTSYSREKHQKRDNKREKSQRGVPDDIGEYVDYEEVDDDDDK